MTLRPRSTIASSSVATWSAGGAGVAARAASAAAAAVCAWRSRRSAWARTSASTEAGEDEPAAPATARPGRRDGRLGDAGAGLVQRSPSGDRPALGDRPPGDRGPSALQLVDEAGQSDGRPAGLPARTSTGSRAPRPRSRPTAARPGPGGWPPGCRRRRSPPPRHRAARQWRGGGRRRRRRRCDRRGLRPSWTWR